MAQGRAGPFDTRIRPGTQDREPKENLNPPNAYQQNVPSIDSNKTDIGSDPTNRTARTQSSSSTEGTRSDRWKSTIFERSSKEDPRTLLLSAAQVSSSEVSVSRSVEQDIPPSQLMLHFAANNTSYGPPVEVKDVQWNRNPIGKGGFAVVFRGTWNGNSVALKLLHTNTNAEKQRKRLIRESLIWQDQDHLNILPFLGVYTDVTGSNALMYMISPWRENGNLKGFIATYPRTNRMKMLLGIASALEYLHGRTPAVVHGDLRTVNILVTDDHVPQLADFGLASLVHDPTHGEPGLLDADTTTANRGGAHRWMAPELLVDDDTDAAPRPQPTPQTDIYSFAMVILEMFTGTRPFANVRSDWAVPPRVLNGERPQRPPPLPFPLPPPSYRSTLHSPLNSTLLLSQDNFLVLDDGLWEQCVTQCWIQDPKKRLSASRLVIVLNRLISAAANDRSRSELLLKLNNVQWVHNPITSGHSALIYHGVWKGHPVALKQLHLDAPEKLQKRILRQSLIWKDLNHPNILPFLGVYMDTTESSRFVYMVSPWRKNGNLNDFLERHPHTNRMKMLIGIASALKYLHGQSTVVVHGDLRAVNILVTDDHVPQLAGFGLALLVHNPNDGEPDLLSADTSTANRGGALRWMAPELLYENDEEPRPPFTPQTDMYSFAMVILEMFTGMKPFVHVYQDYRVVMQVEKGERPPRPPPLQLTPHPDSDSAPQQEDIVLLSDELWEYVVTTCWAQDPKERPSANDVVLVLDMIVGRE